MQPEDLQNGFQALLKAEAAKSEASDHIKEIYASMKAKGYDVSVLRKNVADYKEGMEKVKEFETVVELYRENLGM